jgi:outer membrane protein OmpA-like peptidoglycan-associated protein
MLYTRLITILLVLSLISCATDEYGNSRSLTDAEKGALIGAGIGALIGLTAKKKNKGVVIGAVGGALAGGLVGNYMDEQKQDLEKILKNEVSSGAIVIKKLPEHHLMVRMTNSTTFDIDSSHIKSGFYSTMNKMAKILNHYGKTELVIVGHTDNTGSETHNQKLSERRANAVKSYLLNKNVIPQRLSAHGKGELLPIASNTTASGRTSNRRIEIYVIPIVETIEYE